MQSRPIVLTAALGALFACGGAEPPETSAESHLETIDRRPALARAVDAEVIGDPIGESHECTATFTAPRVIAAGGSARMFWFHVTPDARTTLSLEPHPGSRAQARFERNGMASIDFHGSGGADVVGTAKSTGARDMFVVARQGGVICGTYAFTIISAKPSYHHVGAASQIPSTVLGGTQWGNRMVDEIVQQGDDPLGFRNPGETAAGGIVVRLDITPPGLDPADLEPDEFRFSSRVDRRDYDGAGCTTGNNWVHRSSGDRDAQHYLQFEDAHPDRDLAPANRWTPPTLSVFKYTHVSFDPNQLATAGLIAAPTIGAMVSTRQNGTDTLTYKGDVLGAGEWTFGATMSFDGARWQPDIAVGGDNWLEPGAAFLNFGFETTDPDVALTDLNPGATRRGAFFVATLSGGDFTEGPAGCLPHVQINNGHDVYRIPIRAADVRADSIDISYLVPQRILQTSYDVEIFRGDSFAVLSSGFTVLR